MTILEALTGTSIDNRRTRNELMMTGKSDRAVRVEIHKLRRQRNYIVSDTKESGYWLGTPQEWNAFCDQQRRRALANFYRKTDEDERQLRIV